MTRPLHIIVLAAGDGTRMKSRTPKVLHAVGGRPMLTHVLATAAQLSPAQVHVVYNPEAPAVRDAFDRTDRLAWVPQRERLGTGHAVQQAMPGIPADADVLVLYGDTPLVPASLLQQLRQADTEGLAVLTMLPPDPAGYGRIVRGQDGRLEGIVEHRDASDAQRAINEVNSGILHAPADRLGGWLGQLETGNAQGEYYLTDVVALAHRDGVDIGSVIAPDSSLLAGANDRVQLAELESRYRAVAAQQLMREGVTIIDPARIDLRGTIRAGQDITLDINVVIEGDCELGDNVQVGPGCVLRSCRLAAGTRVHAHSVLEGVTTTGACDIGPFARVRPGTTLAEGTRVGNFVEVKNTTLAAGSKASHLTYLGDAVIGKGVNIGAGTITCNYDGVNKFQTVIGDGAFIGSDTQLVAPVTVGAGATIGAGSTIVRDTPEGLLTLSRSKQMTVKGWKRPRKKD
ncbi:UDP-N-acetylglucosamine diphosphorylase/glucosamine-1-phosphate N-acetyltransferase [Marinihelvus fidelis]|uniref:Bifunctional protein GlmU n=1 Tax=Marinihelvus fidelis TaxID=2613842 RepID=A0A5N0T4M5_9GAMM|nr:bifunctional UDP-N-acetylglucosamine diphosphorylase/glucosamine-1-phosphate N-acetyltransferase GlmU [Marinihelvus fidelis]KAA9129801.1 UDP-N-acetylglucosamine diphosphorylase/glucosamine-1-phosphate N-acetyltransferase [Marinihelvus fidelis]